MQLHNSSLLLAPSDLTAHLSCPRLTVLKRSVARGELKKPFSQPDPHLELIIQHGYDHEQNYLDQLKAKHGADNVVEIPNIEWPDKDLAGLKAAAAQTLDAMRAGPQVIFQAAFFDGQWRGFADFLLRVDTPSALGNYSYEVADTKLARSFKATYAHQLTRYSLHVAEIQELMPAEAHVVLGRGEIVSFKIDDVISLHRRAAHRLEEALADDITVHEPVPVSHCGLCDFERDCDKILRDRDDLSFVATLGADQRTKLMEDEVETLAKLATLPPAPTRGELSDTSFTRVRVQAELQKLTRETKQLQHRHLPAERARGYATLPEPSPGDIFFDLEGDPFVGDNGIEYLWGYELLDDDGNPDYVVIWAHNEAQERAAFEDFIDFVLERRKRFPDLHVYHYAPHELSTLRRLSDQYSSRQREVDMLQRHGVLCDLYGVVRQGIQVGQESYSIKKLEPFYGFERTSSVREGGGSIVAYEKWIEARDDTILDEIALYNREDCASTRELADWLRVMRDEAAAEQGVDFETLREPEPEEELEDPEWVAPLQELVDRLEAGLPEDPADDDTDQAERRLLAGLLFYHRREQKPQWWRFFELQDMTDDQLEGERDAIAGLTADPAEAPIAVKRSMRTWLTFPPQEHRLSLGDVIDPSTGKGAGEIVEIEDSRLLLHRGPKHNEAPLPTALISGAPLDTKAHRAALIRVATSLLEDGGAHYPAVRALLRREAPQLTGREPGTPLIDGHVDALSASAATLALHHSCLAVQGPPGAGKTYTGARMIVAALAAGKRVAVSSTNHKAIHNLIAEVEKVAHADGVALRGMHKHSHTSVDSAFESKHGLIDSTADNKLLDDDDLNLVSGTSWVFSRAEHDMRFDLLFVDEAGQMSLADAVAIGTCATAMVLLGDPQQLPQVSQGTHPDGASASVLEHVLNGAHTIAPDRGLFLGESWRMNPDVCAFISERFYDGRLESVAGCAPQTVTCDAGTLSGAGLRLLEVEHEGRSQYAPEEAQAIAEACRTLLDGSRVTLREDGERALTAADIMVVAPYNMAVREIAAVVPDGVRVGTVDKFQGQEAAVVFYAMTSSSGADVPRGLDFLFQPNRLNVAVSRAQCLAVVVCSPRLMDAECSTLEQMRMVNHVCRYGEMTGARG